MADESVSGVAAGLAKFFGDAKYIPGVTGLVLLILVMFAPKTAFTEKPQQYFVYGGIFYVSWAMLVGFIHTHIAWRVGKELYEEELWKIPEDTDEKVLAAKRAHVRELSFQRVISEKAFAKIVVLHVVGLSLAAILGVSTASFGCTTGIDKWLPLSIFVLVLLVAGVAIGWEWRAPISRDPWNRKPSKCGNVSGTAAHSE